MTLKISNYIYDRLKQLGVPVFVTRQNDETISIEGRVNRILDEFGNDNDLIIISNHINSGGAQADFVIMYNHS